MKKRLILGDIHGHFDTLKKIYDQENPDEVIILGDYFDNFHGSDQSIIDCFENIIKLREEHLAKGKGDFILLIGNHDFHYMCTDEHYSGKRESYAAYAHIRLEELHQAGILKYVHIDMQNKIIYSHAGVTNSWCKEHFDTTDINIINQYINTVGYNYFVFSHKAYRDYYGDSKWHGPLWVRPYSLYGDLYKDSASGERFSQIVGHTHMRQPEVKQFGNATVYVLDTMPDFYMTQKYNDNGEIILYELKEFKQ